MPSKKEPEYLPSEERVKKSVAFSFSVEDPSLCSFSFSSITCFNVLLICCEKSIKGFNSGIDY